MSRYLLIPVDDGEENEITVPQGLIVNQLYTDLKDCVGNKNKLKQITQGLARNGIDEDERGCVTCKERIFPNLNLRRGLVDICNNNFRKNYEQFYEILRENDIVI